LSGFIHRHLSGVAVAVMVVLLIGFVLYPHMLITVPSGHVGVLWKRFSGPGIHCLCILPSGTVLKPSEIRNEGLTIIWPWDKLFIYDLRLQTATQKYNAISKDGVSVTAEITVQYQLNHESAAVLHQFMGPGYLGTVLSPEIGSQTRLVISHYGAEEVYSAERGKIQSEIATQTRDALTKHLDEIFQVSASEQDNPGQYRNLTEQSIKVINVLVLSIELPAQIVAAINNKTEQFYQIEEYKYRAQREAEESERKQIEANGIAAFQRTVSQGISDSYLRWRGIEATLALAQSPNTKIIIVGGGKDGLPIILGNVDGAPAPNPAQKSGTPAAPPTDKTSPASPAAPGTAPQATPATPESKPTAEAPSSDKEPSTSVDLTDIKSILSKLSDVLRASPSQTRPSTTNTKSK
jgi:regulator of protease activity HflC (stomatin/prohibitin superfamily)